MRVLIVEDHLPLAEDLAEILEGAGHTAVLVDTGGRAREAARGGFDLAIVDVRLPDMLGTELIGHLRGASTDAEVIVTTGNADVASAAAAVQAGAFAYLTKPIAPEELLNTARRALEKSELAKRARELQEALARSERRHREIVESVPALILEVDRELVIRFANRAAEQAFGRPREGIVGLEFATLLAPDGERASCRARLRQAFAAAEVEHEEQLVRSDGGRLHVQLRWTRAGHGPEAERIFGLGLDVSRQRDLEEQARVAEKLAAVGTLAAGLAHEVRNPLNAAGLQLALLSRRVSKLPPAERPPLDEPTLLVRTELHRLETLLADFLAFARPRTFARYPIDLASIARQVAALQTEAARATGKHVRLEIPDRVELSGDATALTQVVVNLVQNALDAARHEVVVRAAHESRRVVLDIDDDGPGITEELAARVFEPFFTTKEKGTGLGLSIVHAIVIGHGGKVTLERRPGGGTRARVVLAP